MTKLSMSEEEMLKRKYTRPYEKRIAELEAQIERNKIDLAISEHNREHNDYELTEAYKKIKQLEKENAELKGRNAELKGMYAHSAREAGTYEQFLELKEKENAELKKQLEMSNKVYNDNLDYSHHIEGQLTKAKICLEQLVSEITVGELEVDPNVLKQAENFLKEE